MTGFAILFSIGRYGIRWWSRHKFFWDDLAFFVAVLTMIGMSVALQLLFPDTYFLTSVQRGFSTPVSPEETATTWLRDRKYENAIVYCFLISTWFVKISFMLLYRELFKINKTFMKAWWIVLGIIVVTFWAWVALFATSCGEPKDNLNFSTSLM
jgi:hypothetical protein